MPFPPLCGRCDQLAAIRKRFRPPGRITVMHYLRHVLFRAQAQVWEVPACQTEVAKQSFDHPLVLPRVLEHGVQIGLDVHHLMVHPFEILLPMGCEVSCDELLTQGVQRLSKNERT